MMYFLNVITSIFSELIKLFLKRKFTFRFLIIYKFVISLATIGLLILNIFSKYSRVDFYLETEY